MVGKIEEEFKEFGVFYKVGCFFFMVNVCVKVGGYMEGMVKVFVDVISD